MASETLAQYSIKIEGTTREYPIVIKTGTTKHLQVPPGIGGQIRYFFTDFVKTVVLYLIPTSEQLELLALYNNKTPVIRVDLPEATGAPLWALRGCKTLKFHKEWIQPEESKYQKDRFIQFLSTTGDAASPTFLVSNISGNSMPYLQPSGDDSGFNDSAECELSVASSFRNLTLTRDS
ncbi:matrix protein [Solenopsis invicta virus 15]|uniref:Matrix protein n=1 Tax=Solenopsis invicta virus 15 TaxID=2810811 RepID=A0AAE7U6U4_9MONO|nr:matrix protein [Solenopsis invicta virus 15]QRK69402.1 matrix protein [Solenopsis invicta virus 15]